MTPAPENPPASAPRRMNPNRFVIGQRVMYRNHVTGWDIRLLEVTALEGNFVMCGQFFGGGKPMKFHDDGSATWSPNLSICPTP